MKRFISFKGCESDEKPVRKNLDFKITYDLKGLEIQFQKTIFFKASV